MTVDKLQELKVAYNLLDLESVDIYLEMTLLEYLENSDIAAFRENLLLLTDLANEVLIELGQEVKNNGSMDLAVLTYYRGQVYSLDNLGRAEDTVSAMCLFYEYRKGIHKEIKRLDYTIEDHAVYMQSLLDYEEDGEYTQELLTVQKNELSLLNYTTKSIAEMVKALAVKSLE